jgi:DNA polymerase III psi subunit
MSPEMEMLEQTFTEELYNLKPRVIVLIPDLWPEVEKKDIELLQKILQAVKISLDGVQVISKSTLDLQELSVYAPEWVLSFGTPLTQVKTKYEISGHHGMKVLVADKLSLLDEAKKKILWVSLKQMFLPS